jgi:dihydroxycyclohexadiene carboxylate dehydrogenase
LSPARRRVSAGPSRSVSRAKAAASRWSIVLRWSKRFGTKPRPPAPSDRHHRRPRDLCRRHRRDPWCAGALWRYRHLVNNVGGTIWAKPYAEYAEAQIEAEIRRSLFPTLWCCRAVLPGMLERGAGVIVNVSSVATRGVNRVPYAAAKGGVNAITASLAMEYAAHGIRICGVAPGGTDAPARRILRNAAEPSVQEREWYRQVVDQTISSSLMKRYGTTEEQAAAILFLASDEASYITGVTLPVAGGDLG